MIAQPYAVGNTLTARMHKGINTTLDEGQTPVLAHSLRGEGFDASEDGTGRGTPLVPVAFAETAPTLSVGAHGAAGHPHRQHGNETAIVGMTAWRCPDCGHTQQYNHRGCRLFPAYAFDARQSDVIQYGDKSGPLDTDGHTVGVLAPTLTASNDPSRSPQSSEVTAQGAAVVQATAVAFKYTMGAKAHGIGYAEEQAPTLDTRPESNAVMQAMQVRRLTPVECERLQGFPDDYTAIPWRGKPASECPDGPRYKALGNSWAVPCVRWIGRRIAERIA